MVAPSRWGTRWAPPAPSSWAWPWTNSSAPARAPRWPACALVPAWASPPSSNASKEAPMSNPSALTLDIDANGIGLVTLDQPGRAMNVLNPTLVEPFAAIVERLETDAGLKGLVVTSGKSTFVVGADIDQLAQIEHADEAYRLCEDLKGMMRRLEKCGKPVVAALNGTALGGCLELALACHA